MSAHQDKGHYRLRAMLAHNARAETWTWHALQAWVTLAICSVLEIMLEIPVDQQDW